MSLMVKLWASVIHKLGRNIIKIKKIMDSFESAIHFEIFHSLLLSIL